jgi:Zn-dependent metalloprotease
VRGAVSFPSRAVTRLGSATDFHPAGKERSDLKTIPHPVCGVIPPHILTRLAERTDDDAGGDARATLEQMQTLQSVRTPSFIGDPCDGAWRRRKCRSVYDARHQYRLPGHRTVSEHDPAGGDLDATEAFEGSGATYDFYADLFGRASIDGKGMPLDSTVHYGTRFENALWNGRQMVYGDGDGRIFNRFTSSLDVIGHELTHGVIQYSAALGYSGQTGALNEHLADAFGMMVKHYKLGLVASASDWHIGSGLFGSAVQGKAVRSMAAPGTAYDDPILGRDPQPSHMHDYVDTAEDHGGVHINSGIPNHAFYLAAIELGGKTWTVLGKVWYVAMTERLLPGAAFQDFARATVAVAGELYGTGGNAQRVIANAWSAVGLPVPVFRGARARAPKIAGAAVPAAVIEMDKWRQRPAR